MKKGLILVVVVALTAIMVVGCGAGASENKPIAEVRQEAQTMDVSQLTRMVAKYQKAIEAKKPELQKFQAKLKAIPISEIMGKDAAVIKKEITAVAKSIKALTDRMKVYQTELLKKQ